ncbi:MAG TPA: hypothetical protein VNL70_00315, partial [Tepidisphaeraceae bacterium]|nr:hypothetical protein [Tepidisphaeraceae bacterium]
ADPPAGEVADQRWFRAPSRREHVIGAGLFLGFGLFFVMLFLVQRGWWFRWVMLALGVISLVRGLKHAREAIRLRSQGNGS